MGLPFTGAQAVILLGLPESELPTRSALCKVSAVVRMVASDQEEAR